MRKRSLLFCRQLKNILLILPGVKISSAFLQVYDRWQQTRIILLPRKKFPEDIRSIPLRLYRPDDAVGALPVVLYFHGGGFVGGSIDDADAPARAIAERCPALVLAVGYALAPARPFPAAPEDAHCAALWVLANIERFGGDPQRLAVGGDDAGGNLAASLTLIDRDCYNREAIPLNPVYQRIGDDFKSDLPKFDSCIGNILNIDHKIRTATIIDDAAVSIGEINSGEGYSPE